MPSAVLRHHRLRGAGSHRPRLSDSADLHDACASSAFRSHAVKLGEVTTLHVGLMGTMAQLYLSDLATRRSVGNWGGRSQAKSPAAKPMAMRLSKAESGERRIKADEAEVVERIFRDFAAG